MAKPEPLVRIERSGDIATIVLNRPARRNGITIDMLYELERAALTFRDDEATRAIILRGEGADFSIGADLDPGQATTSLPANLVMRRRVTELGARMIRAIQNIDQPTIAAVRGIAGGGGACIASACDFRVGSRNCQIGYGEVRIAINLMWNALPICVRLVGPVRAKRMVMSGDLFPADKLADWGYLDEVVPEEDLDSCAMRWAVKYAALPPIAVQMIKKSINAVSATTDQAVMHMDADQFLLAASTEDFREGVTAIFENRKPQFKGN